MLYILLIVFCCHVGVGVWLACRKKHILTTLLCLPKFTVPTVAIDSDDWAVGVYIDSQDAQHADERESNALRAVCDVLARHTDTSGRHPCITCFVTVSQLNAAGDSDDITQQCRVPITLARPRLLKVLNKACTQELAAVGYHGLDHRNRDMWIPCLNQQTLSSGESVGDACARIAGADRVRTDAAFAEYYHAVDDQLLPRSDDDIHAMIQQGCRLYADAFGDSPIRAAAPLFLWNHKVEKVWRQHGIRYVHGVNWQRVPPQTAAPWQTRLYRRFACRTAGGLIGVPRYVFLESDESGSLPDTAALLEQAQWWAARGQPVVISTHAWNYVYPNEFHQQPVNTAASLDALDELLGGLQQNMPDLQFVDPDTLLSCVDTDRHKAAASAAVLSTARGWTSVRLAWQDIRSWWWVKLWLSLFVLLLVAVIFSGV